MTDHPLARIPAAPRSWRPGAAADPVTARADRPLAAAGKGTGIGLGTGPAPGPADATDLLGSCAPLRGLTRLILEAALEVELDHHLGAERSRNRDDVNSHNGHRPKTVLTSFGPVEVLMPRDRNGSFSPAILPKYRRDLTGREPLLLSLAARGLPRPDFESRLAELYGDSPPAAPLPRVADRIARRLSLWQRRLLAPRYLVLFADTASVPGSRGLVDLALAVTGDGKRELLGLWWAGGRRPGDPGDTSWDTVFRDLRGRGLQHVSIVAGAGAATHAAARRVWPHASLHAPSPYALQRPRPRAAPPGPTPG